MPSLGLNEFPPLAKALAGALLVGGTSSHLKPIKAALGLVAARATARPWTLLTCCALSDSVFSALAYAVAVLFLARIVEPIYGGRELLKYLSAVIVLTSFLTVAVVTVLYYATVSSEKSSHKDGLSHAGDILFRPMGGFEAGAAALLVAVKQLIPDNEVALLGGALRFRAKHLPGLYVGLMVAGSLLLGGAVRVIPFTLFGTYLAWAYLRFAQTRNGVRGDLSEEFRLASFFPQPLQPPVDRAAGAVTRLTGLGAAAAAAQQHQAGSYYGMGGSALPGSDAGDAARRRERGAKALEERLGLKKGAAGATGLPAGAAAPGGNGSATAAGAADGAAPQAAAAGEQQDVEAGGEA
ncbi:hypothetical protein ABPG75_000798 [Micractinium tetrahymenae]